MKRARTSYLNALQRLGIAVIKETWAGGDRRRGARPFRCRGRALFFNQHRRKTERWDTCRAHARRGRRLPQGSALCWGPRQRTARPEASLSRELLRRLRIRPRREQHRDGLPHSPIGPRACTSARPLRLLGRPEGRSHSGARCLVSFHSESPLLRRWVPRLDPAKNDTIGRIAVINRRSGSGWKTAGEVGRYEQDSNGQLI
jgi:hypothetical protein